MAEHVTCTYHPDGRHLWSSAGLCLCGLDANVLAVMVSELQAVATGCEMLRLGVDGDVCQARGRRLLQHKESGV